MAKNVMLNRKTAWFSSSVRKAKIKEWVKCNGCVVKRPLEADFVFAEDSEAEDLICIYQSEDFLKGHLTIFHSDLISAIAKEETVIDPMTFALLPLKQLEELGINLVQCVRERREESCHDEETCPQQLSSLIHTSTPKSSKNQTITEKHSAQNEVPQKKKRKIIAQKCRDSDSSDDNISEFSTTSSEEETSLANRHDTFEQNCEILFRKMLFGKKMTATIVFTLVDKMKTMFVLSPDIPHLNEIEIPDVLLMDYL